MTFLRGQFLGSAFGIAEHVAPRLAGRVAFDLVCSTPSRTGATETAREAIEAAGPFMLGARQHYLTSSYGSFVCHEFRPASGGHGLGTVLVLHGWGSRTEHMCVIIEALLARGLRVLAPDLPGHGASAGRRLHMAAAVAAAAAVAQWFGPFSAMVGHSFGGVVAVNAAAGSIRDIAPVAARRLVLIATPDAMQPIFEGFARHVALGARTKAALFAEVERVTGRPIADFSGARQVADLGIRTLVLHAPDDREVSPASAEAYAAAGPHVEKRWIEGAGHRRILITPAVAEMAATFALGRSVTPLRAAQTISAK